MQQTINDKHDPFLLGTDSHYGEIGFTRWRLYTVMNKNSSLQKSTSREHNENYKERKGLMEASVVKHSELVIIMNP